MSLIFDEVGDYLQELKDSLLQMTSFTSNKNFAIYEKLGQVYDHLNWTESYHEEIDEEVLIWLCRFVFPKLLLQGLKLIRLSDFTSQIRQWLKFANEVKEAIGPLGKVYEHFFKLI